MRSKSKCSPAIVLSQRDLTVRKQRPKIMQAVPELGLYALRLDVLIKVLVQSLDRVVRWSKESTSTAPADSAER